jgi:hypothetical protein
VTYKDYNAALQSVHDGDSWGIIAIGKNFTVKTAVNILIN